MGAWRVFAQFAEILTAEVDERLRAAREVCGPVPTDFVEQLVAAMNKIADRHPRFGYRRVHASARRGRLTYRFEERRAGNGAVDGAEQAASQGPC